VAAPSTKPCPRNHAMFLRHVSIAFHREGEYYAKTLRFQCGSSGRSYYTLLDIYKRTPARHRSTKPKVTPGLLRALAAGSNGCQSGFWVLRRDAGVSVVQAIVEGHDERVGGLVKDLLLGRRDRYAVPLLRKFNSIYCLFLCGATHPYSHTDLYCLPAGTVV
jgi:hypothetical protein